MGSAEVVGPLAMGPVANGGHCVARWSPEEGQPGRVIFVRHALPGELVRVRLTDTSHDRFWRGDAVQVLRPAAGRVDPPCPIAGPGRCGGCDFQHADRSTQLALKTAVVAEQLDRLAGYAWTGTVEDVGPPDGLGWRTRMRYQVDEAGRAGLRAHRSHAVIPLPDVGCLIAHPGTPPVQDRSWPAAAELVAVASEQGGTLLVDSASSTGSDEVTEVAAGRRWTLAADGFWQVHPAAADILVAAVLDGLRPEPGERAFDLYCGVGLFTGALADAGCQVWGVESSRSAIGHARRNLADAGGRVRFSADRVDRRLRTMPGRTDLVVLDPPRTGAGRAVIQAVLSRAPRAVAYVACDPAALARDLATAAAEGYHPTSLRAYDLFPMTHHVECVAILQPESRS